MWDALAAFDDSAFDDNVLDDHNPPPPPKPPFPLLSLLLPQKPFIEDFNDKFSEIAQWQLFYTLLAALAMKVNLDNENLQDKRYFDMLLTLLQFVPALVVTLKNAMELREATNKTEKLDDLGAEQEEVGLELKKVENPITRVPTETSVTL